jgi:hypothetical protein
VSERRGTAGDGTRSAGRRLAEGSGSGAGGVGIGFRRRGEGGRQVECVKDRGEVDKPEWSRVHVRFRVRETLRGEVKPPLPPDFSAPTFTPLHEVRCEDDPRRIDSPRRHARLYLHRLR